MLRMKIPPSLLRFSVATLYNVPLSETRQTTVLANRRQTRN